MFSRGPTPRTAPETLGAPAIASVDRRVERGRIRADLRDDRPHDAFGLVEQRLEQVLGLDRAGAGLVGDSLRSLERFLRLDGELVESHRTLLPARPSDANSSSHAVV